MRASLSGQGQRTGEHQEDVGAALQLLPTQAAAAPGGQVEVTLKVTNTGNNVDRFRVEVTGVPGDWCVQDVHMVLLLPGETKAVHLTIRPPVGLAATPKIHYLTVSAVSGIDEQARISVEFSLTILDAGALRFDLTPSRATGRRAFVRAKVENQSNAPVTFALMARDAEDGLRFQPNSIALMTLPAGIQRTFTFAARPLHRETIGEPHPYEIDVWVVPKGKTPYGAPDAALLRRAVFIYTPLINAHTPPGWLRRLPGWLMLALLLILLLLIALTGARTAAVHRTAGPTVVPAYVASPTRIPTSSSSTVNRPPAPTIKTFGVTAWSNGAVNLTWVTDDADQVVLDDHVVDFSGRESIDITTPRTLILSATNARGTVFQALALQPPSTQATGGAVVGAQYLPVVTRFTRLLDSRSGAPVLTWHVVSATSVSIDGRPVSSSGQQPAGLGPAAYTLTAANRYGTVSAVLTITQSGAAESVPVIKIAIRPPTIKSFTIQPIGDRLGSVIRWQTVGAHLVLIDGRRVGLAGVLPIGPPRAGQTYTLVADNGYLTSKTSLHLTVTGGRASSGTFTVRMPVVTALAVTGNADGKFITWQIIGAQHVSLGGKTVPATGRAPAPPGSTIIALEASNDAGTIRKLVVVSGPTLTSTAKPTPAVTATATRTPMPTATASMTRISTATSTAVWTPTAERSNTATPRALVRNRTNPPTAQPTKVGTAIRRPNTHTSTPTSTRSDTSTPTYTFTGTVTPSRVPSATPTATRTHVGTRTATPTRRTRGPGSSATATSTSTVTARPSSTPTTRRSTPTIPRTATRRRTPTAIRIKTATAGRRQVATHVKAATATRTRTATRVRTATATPRPIPTRVKAATATAIQVATRAKTATAAPTAPHLGTATGTTTATSTSTPIITVPNTATPRKAPNTYTATPTLVPTRTRTPVPTNTLTPIPTNTFTPVPTATFTPVPTDTFTPVPTKTATPIPPDTLTLVPPDTDTPQPVDTGVPPPPDTSTPGP